MSLDFRDLYASELQGDLVGELERVGGFDRQRRAEFCVRLVGDGDDGVDAVVAASSWTTTRTRESRAAPAARAVWWRNAGTIGARAMRLDSRRKSRREIIVRLLS